MGSTDVHVIAPNSGISLGEVWRSRELLYFLVWRDVKVRYKQAVFGVLWAVIQPVALMLVFTIFLGRLTDIPSDGIPYPVFTYVALVPWVLFSQSVAGATLSLVSNANLLSKVYFPRLLLPASAAGSFLLDFVIAIVLAVVLAIAYGVGLSPRLALIPLLGALTVFASLAFGVLLSALNARYRDVQYAVGFTLQVWLFLSPVAYPSSLIDQGWGKLVYSLNPMAGIIDGFRWVFFANQDTPSLSVLMSVGVVIVVFAVGLRYFRRVELTLADVI